jgi:hypothetical protein
LGPSACAIAALIRGVVEEPPNPEPPEPVRTTTVQKGRRVTYEQEKKARKVKPMAPAMHQAAQLALITTRLRRMRALGLA